MTDIFNLEDSVIIEKTKRILRETNKKETNLAIELLPRLLEIIDRLKERVKTIDAYRQAAIEEIIMLKMKDNDELKTSNDMEHG